MATVVDILLSALFQGSLYAMMAMGLGLLWSTLGIFNFAHGVLMALGAYFAWQITSGGLDVPVIAGALAAMVLVGGVGILLERIAVTPFLANRNLVLTAVITTLASATIVENLILIFWSSRPKMLPPLVEGNVHIFGTTASAHQLAIIVITPIVIAALLFFLKATRQGLALRAVAQNRDAALLVGANISASYMIAFALASMLAALAGVFFGGIKFMSPDMGAEPLSKALIVVILGGLSSLEGPILASYLIALFEAVSLYYLGFYWTPALIFGLLILVLMVIPEGLASVMKRG